MSEGRLFRALLWIPVILWMGVIFCFSAQTAAESSQASGKTIESAIRILYPDFKNKTELQQRELVENFQNLTRKTAHFFLYAVLGIFTAAAVLPYRGAARKRKVLLPLLICVLYAVSDEIHQIFVDGRGPGIADVLIDSAGAVCGILTVSLLAALCKMRKRV